MKLWTTTLAWLAAAIAAVLLALSISEGLGWMGLESSWPHGANAPR